MNLIMIEKLLMWYLKGADTVEEAVAQFYENPNKYSDPNVFTQSIKGLKKSKAQPASNPASNATGSRTKGPRLPPHTNAVINAGNIRARDEVRITRFVRQGS